MESKIPMQMWKCWNSVGQRVKMLLVNKDKTVAAVFFLFVWNTIAKQEIKSWISQVPGHLCTFLLLIIRAISLRVFIKLTEFNYTWNKSTLLSINIFKSTYTVFLQGTAISQIALFWTAPKNGKLKRLKITSTKK